MKNIFKNIGLILGIFSLFTIACSDDIDPEIENLELDRPLAPVNLRAFVRNMTFIELSWNVREGVDQYVVEYSQDSLQFNEIIRTVTVEPDELPLTENFEGETMYSARVKAIRGSVESTWADIAIMTDIENILEPLEGGDITATSITLSWPAGSEVTNFTVVSVDNPEDNILRPITDAEKVAGEATIQGLTGSTTYTVTLFNGEKRRGLIEFETLVDIGNATPVYPEDDLLAMIAAAADGDVLALFPGSYDSLGSISINKSLSIRGVFPFDRPILKGATFDLVSGTQDLSLIDLVLSGEDDVNEFIVTTAAGVSFGTVTLTGSKVSNYNRQLFYGNGENTTVQNFIIDNSEISDFVTSSSDFIDFRKSHLSNLSISNSTFVRCAQGRDFIRIDAAANLSGTGLTTTVLINRSTIIASATPDRRLLYVRFDANDLTIINSLIADTEAIISNQSATSQPDFANNNYFNAPNLISGNLGDPSGASLNPGFADAENDDYTISNQTLLDNQVGDPRWR